MNAAAALLLVFAYFVFNFNPCNAALYTNITKTQSLSENDSLVSVSRNFELGFFSPVNSTFKYVGIWYRNDSLQTVVWVANRNNPLSSSSSGAILKISEDGNLVLVQNGVVYWSTNASLPVNDTAAALLSSGDLVLCRIANAGDELKAFWQSFDAPTNNYLPGMKVLVNQALGENKALVSWKSPSDPANGEFSLGVDPRGSPQFVLWEGNDRRWRSGHWNGLQFVGVPNMTSNYLYGFKLSTKDTEGNMYFTYTPLNTSSDVLRFEITYNGVEEQLMYDRRNLKWNIMQSQPGTDCDFYNKCGNFSTCSNGDDGSFVCNCLEGFEVRNLEEWNAKNWTNGCKRRTALKCQGSNSSLNDGFVTVYNTKLPDFADLGPGVSEDACKQACLNDCSCNGYTMGSGYSCMIWKEDFVDVQIFSGNGKPLYVRLAGSELGDSVGSRKLSASEKIAAIVFPVALLIIFILLIWWYRNSLKGYYYRFFSGKTSAVEKSMRKKDDAKDLTTAENLGGEVKDGSGPELPLFNFNVVESATDSFSDANLLGKGGFGPVYKGKLPDGQEIAVKRLSGKSGQGFEEFRNEITLIAKLQHRNLVRLIGWCIEGDDKMLIYEYMPNKSLDCFLFHDAKRHELDWKTRFAIMEGIARGLLYLHRDSRLRIIHRDLKASNILLDEEMNPKISDFGMARIFGVNQNEANTVRVVGTYGYMAPEYAMEGLFSVKSDVYSFGVLLLEVVSGRRNTSFRLTEYANLIQYAWSLWTENRATDLAEEAIKGSCNESEVLRCIQVAMLCVQDSPSYRPNMSTVIIMLESETANLPSPRPPSFTSMRSSVDTELWTNDGQEQDIVSANDLTLSVVAGR